MGERMTDKRLAEIEGRRLRTPTGKMPDGKSLPPLPADSDVSEQLLQALKAERAKVDELESRNRLLLLCKEHLIDADEHPCPICSYNTLITELRDMAEKWRDHAKWKYMVIDETHQEIVKCADELTALLDKQETTND